MAIDLPEPGFKQFSEAGPVDTGTGEAVAAAGASLAKTVAVAQGGSLRDKVAQQRAEFLTLADELRVAGVDQSEARVANKLGPNGSIAFNLDVDAIVNASAVGEGGLTQITEVELENMAGEIASVKRGTEQGITPQRALEINVETITRKYIDRFPGLSRQFQNIAQGALGTSNNLLTATMRTYDELARANAAGKTRIELAAAQMATDFPLTQIGSQEARERAVFNALTTMKLTEQADLLKASNDLAKERGLPGIPEAAFAESMTIQDGFALVDLQTNITMALPPQLREQGVIAAGSSDTWTDQERIEAASHLEVARDMMVARYQHIGLDQELTTQMQTQLTSKTDYLASLYNQAIESVTGGKKSEQLELSLGLIVNQNLREFESVLGRDALVLSKIASLFPPGSSIANDAFNTMAATQLMARMAAFAGIMSLEDLLVREGTDPDSPVNQALINAYNVGNVEALRTMIFEPEAAGTSQADKTIHIRAMSKQFRTATPEAKRAMLDLVGTEEFQDDFKGADPETQEAMRSMSNEAAAYGGAMIEQLGQEASMDIAGFDMRRRWDIRLKGETNKANPFDFQSKEGSNITTGQLVNYTIDDKGIRITPKSVAQLRELGVETDQENLNNIAQMVAAWDSKLISNINSYAHAAERIGPVDRESIVRKALNLPAKDIVVEEREKTATLQANTKFGDRVLNASAPVQDPSMEEISEGPARDAAIALGKLSHEDQAAILRNASLRIE
jgi:hypothetical protein